MRLINVRTYDFQEFFEDRIPPYAIICHRWGDDELSFKRFRKELKKEGDAYRKIIGGCALARSRGLEWIWLDSCCIDKRSSAELSEAINSMYMWYERSGECYAYMADVVFDPFDNDDESRLKGFRQSEWFTRGWTLQELIAPSTCIFCDCQWRIIGKKSTLRAEISAVTGISEPILGDASHYLDTVDDGEKMSWASKRKTSRSEDMAYCLLGLFKVSMPLLYGEGGTRAFIRLQLEILKSSDDESLFDWAFLGGTNWDKEEGLRWSGLLAPSVTAFVKHRGLYPPFPAYAPPPNPLDTPIDHLAPFDIDGRAAPISLPRMECVEGNTGCPPYTLHRTPNVDTTIGAPFKITKRGFVLNRVATRIPWLGTDYYVVDLYCPQRNRFLSSIVLQIGHRAPEHLATRVHFFGHGEVLRRQVLAMKPVNIGMRQFHVFQWDPGFIDTFDPDPDLLPQFMEDAKKHENTPLAELNLPPAVSSADLNRLF